MAINRAQVAKQLLPGINTIFGLSYGSVDNEHLPLFDMDTSKRAFEEDVIMTGFAAAPVKSEGAAVQYDSAEEYYTARYTHETIALAFALTEEAFEDNLYDTFAKVRAQALGRASASTKQTKAANVYNRAFNSSYVGGDGVELCSDSHPTISDGNQDNLLAASNLSETALETALVQIQTAKDDRGILIGATANSLHIDPTQQFTAERILKSAFRTNVGASNEGVNDVNAIYNMGLLPKGSAINRRFTDTNAYFIRTDIPNGPKMFVRKKMETDMDPDFDTGNLRFKCRERYSFGWSDWRGVYGSAGAS
jgi:hypothetical protein